MSVPSLRVIVLAVGVALGGTGGLAGLASAGVPPRLGEAPVELRPTVRNDTLWDIAGSLRPPAGVSRHQVMAALLRRNPDAFVGGNIFHLRAGVALTAPSLAEVQAEPQEQALALEESHRRLWRGRAQQAPTIYALGEVPAAPPVAPAAPPAAPPAPATVAPAQPVAPAAPPAPEIRPAPAVPPVQVPAGKPESVGTAPGRAAESAPRPLDDGAPARSFPFVTPSLLLALALAGGVAVWLARRRFGGAAQAAAETAALRREAPGADDLGVEAARERPRMAPPAVHVAPRSEPFIPAEALAGTSRLVARVDHADSPVLPPEPWETQLMLVLAETCQEIGQTEQARRLLMELQQVDDASVRAQVERLLQDGSPPAAPQAA